MSQFCNPGAQDAILSHVRVKAALAENKNGVDDERTDSLPERSPEAGAAARPVSDRTDIIPEPQRRRSEEVCGLFSSVFP